MVIIMVIMVMIKVIVVMGFSSCFPVSLSETDRLAPSKGNGLILKKWI